MEGAVVWDLFDVVLEVSSGRVGFEICSCVFVGSFVDGAVVWDLFGVIFEISTGEGSL